MSIMESVDRIIRVNTLAGSRLEVPLEVPAGLTVLGDGEVAPAGWRRFSILSQEDGDKKIVWDAGSLAQIREAKELFVRMVKEGLKPYRVDARGQAVEEMAEFDPLAEEVAFLPRALVVAG
jgi:hypothetical protein